MGQILALTVGAQKMEGKEVEAQKVRAQKEEKEEKEEKVEEKEEMVLEEGEKVMEEKELRMVLDSHRRWLDGEIGGGEMDGERGERASLGGAELGGMKLVGLNLRGVDLCGANLEEADLSNANLEEANLAGANLDKASLKGASLKGASLKGASLFRTDMSCADLRGADLQKARLVQTLLYNAKFYGATLGTNLIGASLTGAKDILAIGPIGPRGDITYAVNHPGAIMIQWGCFWGPLEEWEAKCRSVHRDPAHLHGPLYEAAASFIRASSLYWGREEAQEVGAAKRWAEQKGVGAEQKVVWLADKLAYTCQCSKDTSCGIPAPCPLTIGVNCLDVEPDDWANLAGKRWEE